MVSLREGSSCCRDARFVMLVASQNSPAAMRRGMGISDGVGVKGLLISVAIVSTVRPQSSRYRDLEDRENVVSICQAK